MFRKYFLLQQSYYYLYHNIILSRVDLTANQKKRHNVLSMITHCASPHSYRNFSSCFPRKKKLSRHFSSSVCQEVRTWEWEFHLQHTARSCKSAKPAPLQHFRCTPLHFNPGALLQLPISPSTKFPLLWNCSELTGQREGVEWPATFEQPQSS